MTALQTAVLTVLAAGTSAVTAAAARHGDEDGVAVVRRLARQARSVTDADRRRVAARLATLSARPVVHGTADYPPLLAAAWPQVAPAWLCVAGEVPASPAVGIVGTRGPTLDALRTTRTLAGDLAAAGVTVVSGMARGVDQAAHQAALDAGGRTVAVLGTGLGVDYPAGSADLRAATAEAGALVSELPPDVGIRQRVQFLQRNRILAGLCEVVVVVAGRQRSGAVNTAGWAAAMGRTVGAVPGSPNDATAAAPLALLRDGAVPVIEAGDVLALLGAGPEAGLPGGDGRTPPLVPPVPLAEEVLGLLSAVPSDPSALARRLGAPVGKVLTAAAALEACGLAAQAPAGLVRA